jgi:filamentous hemagglutinin
LGYLFGLGGGRIDLAAWCADGRCTPDSSTTSGYTEKPDGTVIFNPGTDSQGKALTTITSFIDANQNNSKIVSPLGGVQGGQGQFTIPLIGYTHVYQPGSLSDNIIEAYAGTHDALNSILWYNRLGNDKTLTGASEVVGNVTNWTNVILATPVAASIFFTSGAWNAVNALMK